MSSIRTRTAYYANTIPDELASITYELLRTTVVWKVGITTKQGAMTRCQSPIDEESFEIVLPILQLATSAVNKTVSDIKGIYLNYYRNGNDFTPSHRHAGTTQLIISLGATRELIVGKTTYPLNNGDVIVFGGSAHSVPPSNIAEGRISVACFF